MYPIVSERDCDIEMVKFAVSGSLFVERSGD